MSTKPLTPTRREYLKVYIECLLKAERRIRGACSPGLTLHSRVSLGPTELAHRSHILLCFRARGVDGYARALMALRVKRSKFAAELDGLPWR